MSDAPSETARPSLWRWWVCGMLLLASTINYLDRMTLNQTAKRIQQAFALSDEGYSLLESVFVIGFGIGTLVAGWFVDKYGVRWIYPIAVFGWSAFGFATGYAPSVAVLFLCRFGLGAFEAGNWPCGIRTTRQVMPPRERTLGNAFFQNGTAIGAILAPPIILWCLQWAGPDDPQAWRVPFRVIGLIGLLWVALWFLTVPPRVLTPVQGNTNAANEPARFTAIFGDVRFWVLIVVIFAVNTSWHTFRIWLPKFLQQQHGFTETEMSYTSMTYYLVADAGAWIVGLGVYLLTRSGLSVHRGRVLCFAACALIVAGCGLALPYLERGLALSLTLFAFGFGAFGLFPVYFALSQELSGRHQGKVTGTLGAINAAYLAGLFWAEGKLADWLNAGIASTDARRYDQILSVAGVPAVVALAAILLFWPREKGERE